MLNRRRFIQSALLGAGVPLIGLNRQLFANQTPTHRRRLILVELAGANDGLNTLVPFDNDHYHSLRPTLGLAKSDVIPVNEHLGLHPALGALMPLWERGELAWVQGLGYPKANRSHFKSIALWESAGDGNNARNQHGWMTHAIEHQLARSVSDPHGISLAADMSVFASDTGRWLSTQSTADLLNRPPPTHESGQHQHATLALLQQRLQTLDKTMAALAVKLDPKRFEHQIQPFAGGPIGEQLRQVALMIRAGLDTPVYRVQLAGFDTHQNQETRHERLLQRLAGSLSSFAKTLKELGEWENTLVMTYSEFGRRASENKSRGTDHGTAAPHMVLGGSVAGGLYGDQPDLSQLEAGDPMFTMDYRALYQLMLVNGLGADSQGSSLSPFADARLSDLVPRG